MHDTLLFFSKSQKGDHTFNPLYGYEELAESTRKRFGTRKQNAKFTPSGKRKPGTKNERSKGPVLSDVWEIGISMGAPSSAADPHCGPFASSSESPT